MRLLLEGAGGGSIYLASSSLVAELAATQRSLKEKEGVIQVLAKACEERLMLINKLDAELVRQRAAEKRRPKIHGETDVALMKGNVSAI